jgi:photosystem II protein
MSGSAVVVLFVSVTQALAKDLAATPVGHVTDSMDSLVDKFFDRAREVPLLPHTGMDDATLGKAAAGLPSSSAASAGRLTSSLGTSVRVGARPLVRRPVHAEASIQFVKGQDEPCVPDVKLTRSKRGDNGVATFRFADPSIFTDGQGDITGLYMVDDEGELQTQDVQAKYVNGKPDSVVATYVMKSEYAWDRFMRFMERYAASNELGFSKAASQPAERGEEGRSSEGKLN